MRCPECGGLFVESNAPIHFDVKGEDIVVEGIRYLVCESCGEEMLDNENGSLLQRKANDIYRGRHNYLRGEEIKAIREKYALTQESLEDMMGIGPKTLTRWESGSVLQSGVANTLLMLIDAVPEALRWLKDRPEMNAEYEAGALIPCVEGKAKIVSVNGCVNGVLGSKKIVKGGSAWRTAA